MRIRPIVIAIAMTCAFSATAGAFVLVVADPLNIAQHIALNSWRESIYSVVSDYVSKIGHMAQRLSLFTDLKKYIAADPPAWRTRRIVPALPASDVVEDQPIRLTSNSAKCTGTLVVALSAEMRIKRYFGLSSWLWVTFRVTVSLESTLARPAPRCGEESHPGVS